jgi:hypothetical protein
VAKALKRKRAPIDQDPPVGWLKSVHYHHDDYTIYPGEETWISDVGRRTADGDRVYRQDGTPWGEPSWKKRDEIGLYYGGTLRVPVVVEVAGPAEFNPGLVQEESHGQEPDAGERWPWVTPVRGLYRTDIGDAPTLKKLQIEHKRMMRRPKIVLTPSEHRRLIGAFDAELPA